MTQHRYEIKQLHPANGILAVFNDNGVKTAERLEYIALAFNIVVTDRRSKKDGSTIVGVDLAGGEFNIVNEAANFIGFAREGDGTYDRAGWERMAA